MTSRRSSGSKRAESAVEPTRSQNITVSCRRSASPFGARVTGVSASSPDASVAGTPKAAMASSSLRRWPTEVTPSSRKSSAVSRRKTAASMSLSWKVVVYCSSPSPRSQSVISIDIAGASHHRLRRRRPGQSCPVGLSAEIQSFAPRLTAAITPASPMISSACYRAIPARPTSR